MKEYRVKITETSAMTVYVEARSREEAETITEQKWMSGEYVLDAETFVGVEFRAEKEPPNRDMER